ncbi:MAG: 4Fe-4S dicluster domain-containing protein, partial [Desulfobacterota bacterium]|jgi:heterodisulfide reductase subunit C|nr:4Fe-4S dicluster domain-containing protein [Thermodesulfobacteriota bacterium]
MHLSITYGFLGLLLLHALDRYTLQKLFTDYYSTLNPFFPLRNFFGALMLLGIGIAAYRRWSDRVMRLTTRGKDIYALVVLLTIGLSGFFLEATKIVSYERYQEMVRDYGSLAGEEETQALQVYWARDFGVVFPGPPLPADSAILHKGRELHVQNCAMCHSHPSSALVSYGLSIAIQPGALLLTQARADLILWYLHVLACFFGLALLPFTKFFHILTSPLVLLINGVMDRRQADPANIATVQAIELDACTHCATCTQHCSVLPIYRLIPNAAILPSEKLAAFRSIAQGRETDVQALARFQEGASICTGCYRGTIFCPVGIVAQDLWFCMREDLAHLGCPDLFVTTRDRFVGRFDWERTKPLIPLTHQGKAFKEVIGHSWQGSTFSSCYTCMTCSNVCPVVRNYPDPIPVLGLLPHQIMYSLNFGLQEKTLGARMVWDCLGCYQCQEGCPQGVRVADILFELKNTAFRQGRDSSPEHGLSGRSAV